MHLRPTTNLRTKFRLLINALSMKSIESSSKESSAIRRPSLLSLLQGRPKPPAYDEKDVEMAEKVSYFLSSLGFLCDN